MKVLFINAVCGVGSTGNICVELAQEFEKEGHEVKIAYSREQVPKQYKKYAVRIGNIIDVYWHALMTRLFDCRGYFHKRATTKFLKWSDEYNPDILWIHNIHDYVINFEMLFDWIKRRPNMQVKWTQHDCWAFTGGCMHYVTKSCNQWITGCESCPKEGKKKIFPLKHKEKEIYKRNKEIYSSLEKIEIIVPSNWMFEQVKKSILKKYAVIVKRNIIDFSIFKPRISNFRSVYGIDNKFIILGVANVWSEYKGLADFCKLSKLIDSKKYQIVLVGLSKKQIKEIPSNIIAIKHTDSQEQLAEIYTMADIFFNPTYADTYPTVNLEAEACGTRVITYNTGGSPETIKRKDSIVIPQGEYKLLLELIETGFKTNSNLY